MTDTAAKWWTKVRELVWFLRHGPAQVQVVRQEMARVEAAMQESLADFHGQVAALTTAVTHKAADVDLQFVRNSLGAELRREAGWLRDRISAFGGALDRLQDAGGGATGQVQRAQALAGVAAAEESFYPALEQQFRGTPDELRTRLMVYRPWLDGLPAGAVGDLGCGRGEWLQLLREWGRDGVGVDLNPLNAAKIEAQGLHAVCADVVAWLEDQPDNSMAALTSFHVVEHLPFGVLLKLVEHARRVLKPGGRLILETPNPENLTVATQSFWLDPTHLRPLPPALLEFLAAYTGLAVEATVRLNPPVAEAAGDEALRSLLMQGRDYAVIARKAPLSA